MIQITVTLIGPGSRVSVFDKTGRVALNDWHGGKLDSALRDIVTDDGSFTTYRTQDLCPLE